MKPPPVADAPVRRKPVKALVKVLGQSEEVMGLVEEAAADLSAVNAVLKDELEGLDSSSGFGTALLKSEMVEDKVQQAAEKLSVVNLALKEEVRERHVLEIQLAAVVEREESSRNAALHDALTGLPNRALFNDRLEHGLAQAKREGWNLAVMFIDLNGFRKINDTYGHDAGDKVLKLIAARLRENSRDDDSVSRHGGDEFLYLLTQVKTAQDLTSIAEKIIGSVQKPCSFRCGNRIVHPRVSASVGIAIFPEDGSTAQALVKSADKAMYEAKAGKTGYAFA